MALEAVPRMATDLTCDLTLRVTAVLLAGRSSRHMADAICAKI